MQLKITFYNHLNFKSLWTVKNHGSRREMGEQEFTRVSSNPQNQNFENRSVN